MQDGEKAIIIAVGNRVHPAVEATHMVHAQCGVQAAVFDPIWLKPLPKEQLLELFDRFKLVLFVEEGTLSGGFSSYVMEMLADAGRLEGLRIKRLGIPDRFIEHGKQQELRAQLGLRAQGIANALQEMLTIS